MEEDWGEESPDLVVVPHLIWVIASEIIENFEVWPQKVKRSHIILRLGPSND